MMSRTRQPARDAADRDGETWRIGGAQGLRMSGIVELVS